MGVCPPALPVVVAPWVAAGEESDALAEAVVDADDVESVLAGLDEPDAQPARVAPMAISENKTEILMFLLSVFMAK